MMSLKKIPYIYCHFVSDVRHMREVAKVAVNGWGLNLEFVGSEL